MGITVHPNTLNDYKRKVYKKKSEADPSERIQENVYCAFAHDNIDADLNKTAVSDGVREKSFHGTISVAQQMKGLPPIRSRERYQVLPTSVKKASDLLPQHDEQVKAGKEIMLGIVACFSENLPSPSADNAATLGHILRLTLKGHASGTAADVEHLLFLEMPSNNSTTTHKVPQNYLQAVKPRTGENKPDYIIANADMPLYVRIWEAIYGCVAPGQRNVDLDPIVPFPGGMHFIDMCFYDAAKRLGFHAIMDGLVQHSGLTEGAASRFRSCKDPKTNHRVFDQLICALVRRTLDCIIESGDIAAEELPQFKAGSRAESVEDRAEMLRHLGRDRANPVGLSGSLMEEGILLNESFPGDVVRGIGRKVLSAIQTRAERIDQSQFKHFVSDLLVDILLPCVLCHYLSRAGQIKQRTAMVKHLSPALFCTGKVNYHKVMLFFLNELECAPQAVRSAMLSPDTCTTNLSGTNPFGNVEKDEALEETGVARTKEGASTRSPEALKISFYTSGVLSNCLRKLRYELTQDVMRKDRGLYNYEKRLSRGAFRMYLHLCGSEDRPAWLGDAHCSMELMSNINVTPALSVPKPHSDLLLRLRDIGKANMDRAGIRFIPILRARASPEELTEANTLKCKKLEMFSDSYKVRVAKSNKKNKAAQNKGRSMTTVTTMWRQRTLELRQLLKILTSDVASGEEKYHAKSRYKFLEEYMTLMSINPDAFLDSTGENPRKPQKSKFLPKLQDCLGEEGPPFICYGYPDIRPRSGDQGMEDIQNVLYAVDLMNCVHTTMDYEQALTVRMHIQKCAKTATRSIIKNHRRRLLRLDLHCDTPEWVVTQKRGTQIHRDQGRTATTGIVSNESGESRSVSPFKLDSVPEKNWKGALADRGFKNCLTVSIGGQSFIEAAQQIFESDCRATLTIAGIRMFVTSSVQTCEDPNELDLYLDNRGRHPVAVIRNRYESIDDMHIDTDRDTDSSWVWSVSLQPAIRDTATGRMLKPKLLISRETELDSYHGESETRIQYQLYTCSTSIRSQVVPRNKLKCVQESMDTDNTLLALLAHVMCGNHQPENTFIKGHGKYIDIKAMLEALSRKNIDPLALVRLYCITGNDFNHSTEVASLDRQLRTLFDWKSHLDGLSTSTSVLTHLYLSFLRSVRSDGSLPPELSEEPIMSSHWRRTVREAIACRTAAKSTAHILPQDNDLELVYKRAVLFNYESYWSKTLTKDVRSIQCDESMGYNKDGMILMSTNESFKLRKQLLNQINAKCGCKKGGGRHNTCCNAGSRCSCRGNAKKCDQRCSCSKQLCSNNISSNSPQAMDVTTATVDNNNNTPQTMDVTTPTADGNRNLPHKPTEKGQMSIHNLLTSEQGEGYDCDEASMMVDIDLETFDEALSDSLSDHSCERSNSFASDETISDVDIFDGDWQFEWDQSDDDAPETGDN